MPAFWCVISVVSVTTLTWCGRLHIAPCRKLKKQKTAPELLNLFRRNCRKMSLNQTESRIARNFAKNRKSCKLLTIKCLYGIVIWMSLYRLAKESISAYVMGRFRWWFGPYQALKRTVSWCETGCFVWRTACGRIAVCPERAFRMASEDVIFSGIRKMEC